VREYCGILVEVGTYLFVVTPRDDAQPEQLTRLLETKPILEFKSLNHRNSSAVVRCALAQVDKDCQS
jgi:hypothetical protein